MKTADEIYEEMKRVFADETGHTVSDDCDMGVRLYTSAVQAEALYWYGRWVTRQAYPQTAEGEYLDAHGNMRELTRFDETKAAGSVRFYISGNAKYDIAVPAGTVCLNAAGEGFVTTENGSIPAGSSFCDVMCEALVAGKAGNAASNTVVYMTNAPAGIEGCTNPAGFTGGADRESDEDFRERILESYKELSNGANAAWYKNTALGVTDVAAVSVVPCAEGAGTVDVIVASAKGAPDAALLKAVNDAFEGKRELGITVAVKAPTELSVNVTAEVKIKSGFEPESVLKAVETEINSLFSPSLLGRNLYISQIAAAVNSVDGVESYHVKKPTSDIYPAASVLPVAGKISVSRWI